MADCEREAVDPRHNGALCPEHHPETDPGVRDDHADDPGGPEPSEETTETGENHTPGGGSPRSKPGGSVDASPSADSGLAEAAHEAFADAIEFYHEQLDTELPVDYADTARDYYENVREWAPETIDEKLLGYAPGNCKDELLAFLHNRGHDRDAIQASGLFYEGGLKPHFNGRFVLPYFDDSGDPVYAISRSIDEDNSGHPNDHHGDQKYTKAIKAQDYSAIDEPIYGLSSVDQDTDRLLVAGGIADAITLHEAGFACISPVTTVRIKDEHEQRVVSLVDEYDIDTVYIVNDAERPTVDAREPDEGQTPDSIRDLLTIHSWGEGLRGAFGNADFLLDEDVETYLVDLPAGDDDLRKVDPDDYVKEDWGSVETLLASAKPVEQHRGYTRWSETRKQRSIAQAKNSNPSPATTDSEASALFDLDFSDVCRKPEGFRGKNPLGHHGESEDYFVVYEDGDKFGYDYKYSEAYNALTFAACEAGERRASDPNGRFSSEELLGTWVHAKTEGYIPADDPVPCRALQHVARETTDWDGDLVEHETRDGDTFGGLPADVYNDAVDAVREEYDVDPGRGPIGDYDPTTSDPTAGEFPIRTCEPPAFDADRFDARDRWAHLQGERYDAALDHDGPVIWADPAGAGKSTNAVLGALGRDRDVAPLFDKHEKAREVQTDDALPADWDPFHLKGAEQKRDDVCMDADHADDRCPEHGHTSACPSMCPVYDLPADHDTRRRYEAVAAELGDVKAHLLLAEDLPGHDDDGRGPWSEQFDRLESVDDVVGVHEYQTLKTVRDGRDVIVDESPSSLRETTRVDVEGLIRTANALDDLAGVLSRDDPTRYTAERVARFVRDLADALTTAGDGDPALADLEPPAPVWNAYEAYDDAAGNYVEREEPSEPWHLAEALAQLKVTYTETLVSRIRRDEWEGTPLCIDAILTAAAEAGLSTDPVMKAVAVPSTLDDCPWCSSDLEHHDGRSCCSACEWDEQHNTLTHETGEHARASAHLQADYESTAALEFEQLPLQSELPDDPLILDATATPSKVARLYDVDPENLAVYGDDHLDANMRVTQVLDGQYHASTIRGSMTGDDGEELPREEWGTLAERIQTTIDTAADLHDRPLFVVKAGLKPLFDFPDHGEVLHYHATRGLNREECDAVVCIGAPHPDVDDLRREAELLAMGADARVGGVEHSTRRDAPNPPVYRKLNYADEQGRGRAVPTKHYTGLVGDLFRETREKELEQAVHRARPLLADDAPVDVYLLTNVPTSLPIDEVCTFDELADPLEALLPVRDGALDLLDAVNDVLAGDGPDGFRAEALVDDRDGDIVKKVDGFHRLATLSGLDVTERTVRNWIDDLEAVGLLQAGEYEQHAGVGYTADIATLKAALSVISNNTGFEVAAVRRFRALAETADGTLEWLEWAREALGLGGDRCEWDPPPSTPG